MRSPALIALLAAVLAAGCATTPTAAPTPEPPPTMRVIEGRPEPPSAVQSMNDALKDLATAEALAARHRKEAEDLRSERDALQRQLAESNSTILTLRTKVEQLTRDSEEAMDALLACEIEKAVLERRLLEIRLADLRKASEETSR